ncbi:hypothetical protein DOTSEDRAFT_27636 [Dothistroma septosporum NZE10]|uniref:Uncharacterized protein n=1 Tax=Dothistroma septosporum (strain NZE10 / CBS 128990) TaxID=675120 RepID=N1PF96_DOTSN|nr:hypothetical protein DOTSEDRAFT_27636 [Dothistroma septosporum NZE10]
MDASDRSNLRVSTLEIGEVNKWALSMWEFDGIIVNVSRHSRSLNCTVHVEPNAPEHDASCDLLEEGVGKNVKRLTGFQDITVDEKLEESWHEMSEDIYDPQEAQAVVSEHRKRQRQKAADKTRKVQRDTGMRAERTAKKAENEDTKRTGRRCNYEDNLAKDAAALLRGKGRPPNNLLVICEPMPAVESYNAQPTSFEKHQAHGWHEVKPGAWAENPSHIPGDIIKILDKSEAPEFRRHRHMPKPEKVKKLKDVLDIEARCHKQLLSGDRLAGSVPVTEQKRMANNMNAKMLRLEKAHHIEADRIMHHALHGHTRGFSPLAVEDLMANITEAEHAQDGFVEWRLKALNSDVSEMYLVGDGSEIEPRPIEMGSCLEG